MYTNSKLISTGKFYTNAFVVWIVNQIYLACNAVCILTVTRNFSWTVKLARFSRLNFSLRPILYAVYLCIYTNFNIKNKWIRSRRTCMYVCSFWCGHQVTKLQSHLFCKFGRMSLPYVCTYVHTYCILVFLPGNCSTFVTLDLPMNRCTYRSTITFLTMHKAWQPCDLSI